MGYKNILNLPNSLTLLRLVVSPLTLPVLMTYLLPYNNILINYFLAFLFVAFSITDFFDGYFARKLDQVTILGTILDPIADKFLIYSALIALLAAQKIFFFWVVVLIGREFFMMGLRQIALEHRFSIPVSFWAKFKTFLEMICITVIIINPYRYLGYTYWNTWNVAELVLLASTIALSLITARWYYQDFLVEMYDRQHFRELHGV